MKNLLKRLSLKSFFKKTGEQQALTEQKKRYEAAIKEANQLVLDPNYKGDPEFKCRLSLLIGMFLLKIEKRETPKKSTFY